VLQRREGEVGAHAGAAASIDCAMREGCTT
jgi:hypothetical protein